MSRQDGRDIIVTTPKNQMETVAEEARQCIEVGSGFYVRTFRQRPKNLEVYSSIFYVEDGYIRGYCRVDEIVEGNMQSSITGRDYGEGYHVIMRASSWKWISPIPMKGFQGWRYFDSGRYKYRVAGYWQDPKPPTEEEIDPKLLKAVKAFLRQLKKRDPRKGIKRKKYCHVTTSRFIEIGCPETIYASSHFYHFAVSIKTGDVLGKSDNYEFIQSKCFGNVYELATDEPWDNGLIVWDGHSLKIPEGQCDECGKTKGVKKVTKNDLAGLSEWNINRYGDKLLCSYCRATLTRKTRRDTYQQKKKDNLTESCKLQDKPITEYVERLLELLFEYGPRVEYPGKEYEKKITRDFYGYYVRRNGCIIISTYSYSRWILLSDGNLSHENSKGKPMRSSYFGNIVDLIDEDKWKDGTISWDGSHFNTPMTNRKCEVCGRTDGVRDTVAGLCCQYCRSADMRHINTVRHLGGTPNVGGVPFVDYNLE